jgi:ABC-2 type transport system ATP-binding protein
MEFAVQAEGLRKRYRRVEALRGVDLAVPAGTVCGLLGPNGAGKTTVVRILATLLVPDAGWARVGGIDVVREPTRARFRIGLAGQYAAVDPLLTGRANLTLFGRLYHLPGRRAKQRADELLERFDLVGAANQKVGGYSGGMRRRLDVAASLIVAPEVLFLDEPTTGLDPRSRLGVWELIEQLVADGTTVLLTTQYLDEADRLADQIVVLDGGSVAAAGRPDQLKAELGGERLDVVLRRADQLGDAVEAVRAALDTTPAVEPAERRLIVAASDGGTAALLDVVRALDRAGIAVEDIALRRPTLDEVFLTLTSRTMPEVPPARTLEAVR